MKPIYISILLFLSYPFIVIADNNRLLIQSTTSTRDSGFYEYMLPHFVEDHNINVSVVSVGTGQAIKNASRCDGDLLIVHSPVLEEKFVSSGYGLSRANLMHNNFVVIGPSHDPAKIRLSSNISEVFSRLYTSQYKFISRGDDSGTHLKEKELWEISNLNISNFDSNWYLESGQGMGATLNITIGLNAYTLTDHATWLRFTNKSNHISLYNADNNLHNQYGIIKINPQKCPYLNHNAANIFYNWILSTRGQDLIDKFTINDTAVFKSNIIK